MDISDWDVSTVTDLKDMFDMGTTSDVYIAIDGRKYITELLANRLPELLAHRSIARERRGAFYFRFENINWYLNNTKMDETRLYLRSLDDEDYGLMALHEDRIDITEQGEAYRYDLYVYRRMNNEIRKLFDNETSLVKGRANIQDRIIDKRIKSK